MRTKAVIGLLAAAGIVTISAASFWHTSSPPAPAASANQPLSQPAPNAIVTSTEVKMAPQPSRVAIPINAAMAPELIALATNRGNPRVAADFSNRVRSIQSPEEFALVIEIARDPTDRDTERHEALSLLRRSQYKDIDALLWEILSNSDNLERFRSFATQHLGQSFEASSGSLREDLRQKLRRLLNDRHLAVRREALQGLLIKDDTVALNIVKAGLSDPAWKDARDLLISSMESLNWRDKAPDLRPLAYDTDESVRIAAINLLGKWGDDESRAAFEEAKGSARTRLHRAGTLALARLDQAIKAKDSEVDAPTKADAP